MVSLSALLVAVGFGAIAFGPKELPKIARTLGNLTGQAVGTLLALRKRFTKFAQDNELVDLHKEVREGLEQLQAIQSELRSSVNIIQPGPYTQRMLRRSGASWPSPTPTQTTAATAAAHPPPPPHASPTSSPMHTTSTTPFAEAQPDVAPSSTESGFMARQDGSPSYDAPVGTGQGPPSTAVSPQFAASVLPLSAVAAGLIPNRCAETPAGGDIMMDALMEEHVAKQAKGFFRQMQGPPQGTPPSFDDLQGSPQGMEATGPLEPAQSPQGMGVEGPTEAPQHAVEHAQGAFESSHSLQASRSAEGLISGGQQSSMHSIEGAHTADVSRTKH